MSLPGPAALLLLLSAGATAAAQEPLTARRGDLQVRVPAKGTVVAQDVFRLKATIQGRVEAVIADTFTWRSAGSTLGLLANRELAAIIDARGSTPQEMVQERWQKVYKPTAIRCPYDCFLLKSYVRARQTVQPQALLFEAAKGLRLEARVGRADAGWVRFGQRFEFWPVTAPSRRLEGTVVNYSATAEGGRFQLDLSPERSLDPGTEWEGVIHASVKRNILLVPTSSLITHAGGVYVPVRVSTGLTADGSTEVTAGLQDSHPILNLRGTAPAALPVAHSPAPKAAELAPAVKPKPVAGLPEGAAEDPYAE